MHKIFVEARSKVSLLMPDSVLQEIKKLPERIGIVTTVQHYHKIGELRKQLESVGKKIFTAKGYRTKYKAQILGCDVTAATAIKDKVNVFLYVGTGVFHPIEVSVKTGKKVYTYNPYTKKLKFLGESEILSYNRRKKAGIKVFLSSQNIGILVSTKPGQQNMRLAFEIKKKIEEKHKNAFLLLFDTLDFSQLENFPFVDCFVNTACPRIIDDYSKFPKPVVNIEDIKEFLF